MIDNKYEVGDWVVFTNKLNYNWSELKVGNKYKIIRLSGSTNFKIPFYIHIKIGESEVGFDCRCFELTNNVVEEIKPYGIVKFCKENYV